MQHSVGQHGGAHAIWMVPSLAAAAHWAAIENCPEVTPYKRIPIRSRKSIIDETFEPIRVMYRKKPARSKFCCPKDFFVDGRIFNEFSKKNILATRASYMQVLLQYKCCQGNISKEMADTVAELFGALDKPVIQQIPVEKRTKYFNLLSHFLEAIQTETLLEDVAHSLDELAELNADLFFSHSLSSSLAVHDLWNYMRVWVMKFPNNEKWTLKRVFDSKRAEEAGQWTKEPWAAFWFFFDLDVANALVKILDPIRQDTSSPELLNTSHVDQRNPSNSRNENLKLNRILPTDVPLASTLSAGKISSVPIPLPSNRLLDIIARKMFSTRRN